MSERDIFLAALDLPADQRAAFLAERCGADADLRKRVDALFQAYSAAGSFLDGPPIDNDSTASFDDRTRSIASEPVDEAGQVIAGRYKLLERIGEGGMGSVWTAQQTEPVKRKVAVKLIKAGMDTKTVLARFEAERQALALMDHPNISKVFDGGVHDGQPFFVMELVKGVPITEFCDARKLTPQQRLDLFVPVCQAIQHAHQKGVIHRDIKPANVLVALYDDRPVPKVIDFGVAKATGPTLTEHTLNTGFGGVVGTPQYMSPEQATFNNLDIDTRSDVYGLGVLLYELLAGSPPFKAKELEKRGLLEILRVVREEEPPKPSTKLSTADALPSLAASRGMEPKKLTGLLRNELDWIVMKALEKDRTRRYETANGFAADIQRYLTGAPVQAHPPSAGYRLKKFVRKNKGPVVAGSLVFLALLLGITGTVFGLVRAERAKQRESERADDEAKAKEREADERAKAETAYAKTADVLDVMVSEVTGDSLATQNTISEEQKKFLTEVLTYYREFAGVTGGDEKTRLRTVRAAFRVGLIEFRLGRKESAVTAFQTACRGYETLVADYPTERRHLGDLAACYTNLGVSLSGVGKRAEAADQYRKGILTGAKLVADHVTVPAFRGSLATCHTNLALILAGAGKRTEAEQEYRKGLAFREELAADFPNVPAYRADLAVSRSNLGVLLAGAGRWKEAEELYRQGLALQDALIVDWPKVPRFRAELARTCANLGNLLSDQGKQTAATEQYRRGLTLQEMLTTDYPTVAEYRADLAGSHNRLGQLFAGTGVWADAEAEYRTGLALWEKLVANFPALPAYRSSLVSVHENFGNLLADRRRLREAEDQFRMGLAIQMKLVVDSPTEIKYLRDLAACHTNLGNLLTRVGGKRVEAEEEYRKGVAVWEKLVADFPTVTDYQVNLGGCYCNVGNNTVDGDPADGLVWYGKAIALLTRVHEIEPRHGTATLFLRNSYLGRAGIYALLLKHAEAVKDWDKVVEFSPKAEQPQLRAWRATSKLNAGQVSEAVAEVAEVRKSPNWNANQWYDFARVYSVASGKIADKKAEYANAAMEMLQKAVKAGYKDAAHLKADTDLDPLRDREDFQKLLAELETKFPPKREVLPAPRKE